MIVLKFGGSSVDSAAGIERVVRLVGGRLERRPVVVVSAMAKTTHRLLGAAAAAALGDLDAARAAADELEAFHRRAAEPAVAPGSVDGAIALHFGALGRALEAVAAAGEVTPRMADLVAGFGELAASAILTEALRRSGIDAALVDCRRVIVTDDRFTRAAPDYEATDARLQAEVPPLLAAGRVPVLGGYVGATREGVTTTLGKEGSDFSAAIVGAALGALEVQLWTDVDGILTADPALFPGARPVPALTFAEALELACSGSKKPHPGTLEPASRRNVPIRILNSRRPEAPGTLIGPEAPGTSPGPEAPGTSPAVRSIACRTNDHLLYALADPARSGNGFHPRVLAACAPFRTSLLVLGGTAAGLSLALQRAERLAEVREALGREAEVGVAPGRAVVSLVGEDLGTSPELAGRALDAAREHDPRLVLEGVACPVVRFLVEESEIPEVVALLHGRLFPESASAPAPGSASGALRR